MGSLAIPSLSFPSDSLQRPPIQALYPKHPCWRYLSTWCKNLQSCCSPNDGKNSVVHKKPTEEMGYVLWLEGSVPGWTHDLIEREARKQAPFVIARGVPGFGIRVHWKRTSLVCSVSLRVEEPAGFPGSLRINKGDFHKMFRPHL